MTLCPPDRTRAALWLLAAAMPDAVVCIECPVCGLYNCRYPQPKHVNVREMAVFAATKDNTNAPRTV